MRELLHFDSMITPKVITFIYWLLLIGCTIICLTMIVTAFGTMRYSAPAGIGQLVLAPIAAIFGAVVSRIYCEILIVIFKMNEALQDIRQK